MQYDFKMLPTTKTKGHSPHVMHSDWPHAQRT